MDLEKEVEQEIFKTEAPAPKKKPSPKPPKRLRVHTDAKGALVNVRSDAELGDNIVGTLTDGDEVTSKGTFKNFTRIMFEGKTAYVMTSKLVEI